METSSAFMRVCGIGIRTDWPRHTLTGRSISYSKKSPTSLPVAALLIAGGAAADAGRIEGLTASRRPSNTTRGQIVGRVALGTRDPGVSRCARARVVGLVRFCLRSHHVICQNVSTAPVRPGSAPIKNGALPTRLGKKGHSLGWFPCENARRVSRSPLRREVSHDLRHCRVESHDVQHSAVVWIGDAEAV